MIVDEVIPAEVQENPDAYERIGEDYHDELDYVPGGVQVARTVMPKFRKKEEKHRPPVQAPAPQCDIPGTMITAALAVQIVLDKHCDFLTHYRIAARMKREFGIDVSDRTINQWAHLTAKHLQPIAEAICEELHACDVLQIDETPINYLAPGAGKAQKGYLWVMRDPETAACYYHWETGRGNEALKNTLGYDPETNTLGFTGTIQCDGYSVYKSIQKEFSELKLAGCLAHIRRYFVKDPTLAAEAWAAQVLKLIQDLYSIERELKDKNAPPDEVLRVRRERAKPITDELKRILQEQLGKHRPSSSAGKALTYALGQWESFLEYLEDPKIEIDNNGVERTIRPTKIGAKNHLFFGSAEAGVNNAVLYTLIENCKSIGLNPRVYIEHSIKAIRTNEPAKITPKAFQDSLVEQLKQAA